MSGLTHRSFVSYIDKSREYYAAHGYERPYQWAHPTDAPSLLPLAAPLSTLRVGLLTTAYPLRPAGAPVQAKAPYAQAIEPVPTSMFTDDLAWDRKATHTNDNESYLPIARLSELVQAGRIGSLSPRFYGVPTDYSQRRTIELDAPVILDLMRADGVQVAMLVPL